MIQSIKMEDEETLMTLISALSSLPTPQVSLLTNSLQSLSLRRHRRLFSLLCSPSAFSLSLRRLHSLSLPSKSRFIATHLLLSLHHLTRHFLPPPPPPPPSLSLNHRDLDSILLLLLLCEVHHHHPDLLKNTPDPSQWREILINHCSGAVLTLSFLGHCGGVVLPYIEEVASCRRLVVGGGGGDKEGKEVAAAPSAVVDLPAVEMGEGGGGECAVCREEMEEGRDVCELPCQHRFHWKCVLPWLEKRNTCPCCRFQLPSDDVVGEIQRLWSVVVKAAGVAQSEGYRV